MIPLVSANREVSIVKERIDQTAAKVSRDTGIRFTYSVGAMVETPRAALRAGELASNAAFLSFGTNDLTQLAYGISRTMQNGSSMSMSRQTSLHPIPSAHGPIWSRGVARNCRSARTRNQQRPETLDLRRTWRRSRKHSVFPANRLRLRILLAIPSSHRPPLGRATRCTGREQKG